MMIRTTITSSSLPFSNAIIKQPSLKRNYHQHSFLQVKAQQSFRDEGRLNGMVDANLSVLRERIEEVKLKEGLERCCSSRCEKNGWNYASGYDEYYNYKKKHTKKDQFGREFLQLVGLVGGTIGFTCLSGTLFLCLLSIFVHLNQGTKFL
ncbi:hypothetical protein ACOSQ3_026663 [Xanthoceras sorbifolium]